MDAYREEAKKRWLNSQGSASKPPAPAGTPGQHASPTTPSSTPKPSPVPQPALRTSQQEIADIIDLSNDSHRKRSWDDEIQLAEDEDEALARRLQQEENERAGGLADRGLGAVAVDLGDEELARRLQEEEDAHMSVFEPSGAATTAELVAEPTPDIYALFRSFNATVRPWLPLCFAPSWPP